MAIPHLTSGQVISLQPLGAALAGARTRALVKSQDIELVRIVLPQGKTLAPHAVRGDITLLCLEGAVEVELGDTRTRLESGQLLYLEGGVAHGLRALSDASLLLTIALRV